MGIPSKPRHLAKWRSGCRSTFPLLRLLGRSVPKRFPLRYRVQLKKPRGCAQEYDMAENPKVASNGQQEPNGGDSTAHEGENSLVKCGVGTHGNCFLMTTIRYLTFSLKAMTSRNSAADACHCCYLPMWTSSTEISAGETPLIRLACPGVNPNAAGILCFPGIRLALA